EAVRPRATGHRATREGAALSHNGDVAGLERCAPGPWGGGRYVRVAFGGESGWLVYRAPRGGTQVVDLFLCDTESPERSATLPLG
ncbi:MAG TPA: hypothetical protein VFV89_19785, partial [Nocardioides sp.]|uniref:hypothetical protein n=1 Tax=Nocardioides sp. TaxID=35761 RepID=UPI002E36B15E